MVIVDDKDRTSKTDLADELRKCIVEDEGKKLINLINKGVDVNEVS